MSRLLTAVVFATLAGSVALAQTSMPPGQPSPFKDTSILKPPPGVKVAIVEFEDLECPACARAFPIVHEAIKHYGIPLARYDFPLPMHLWSKDAADMARYIQDKVSADLATEYRREVFASQYKIASKDDLHNFTQQFFKTAGKQMPFALGPEFDREVMADKALGDKLGLTETPTIVVVTPRGWIQVKDIMQLYAAIDQAKAATASMTAEKQTPVAAKHTAATSKR